MAKKKKGQRADGLIEIARKMPDGKTRHFYGHSRAEREDKYRLALVDFNARMVGRVPEDNKTHSKNRKKIAVRDSHSLLTM